MKALCFLLALVVSQPAPSAGVNWADGTLTVDDDTVSLRYAYLDREPLPYDRNRKGYVLTLTNVALTPKQLSDRVALSDLAEDRRVSFVQMRFAADQQLASVEIHHPALLMGYTAGMGSAYRFRLNRLTESHAEGRAWLKTKRCARTSRCAYDVTFKASLSQDAQ